VKERVGNSEDGDWIGTREGGEMICGKGRERGIGTEGKMEGGEDELACSNVKL